MKNLCKCLVFVVALTLVAPVVPVKALTLSELPSQPMVLGDSTAYPYPTSSLVNDGGTIYFINGTVKDPITSWSAFVGLGYSIKNVVKGSLSAYQLSPNYKISTANMAHPWGSWVAYKNTIYYSSQDGIIGVPSLAIFTSNGGKTSYIVKANKYDVAVLNLNPSLPVLTDGDSRTGVGINYKFNPTGNAVSSGANFSNSSFQVSQNPAFYSNAITLGSVGQKIASYILVSPMSKDVKLNTISITVQPNSQAGAPANFANLVAKVNGTQFGEIVSSPGVNSSLSFASSSPVLVPQNSSVVVDIYADVLSTGYTVLNPATNFTSCASTTVAEGSSVNCNAVYGQNLSFVTNSFTNSAGVITSSLNSGFNGGAVIVGTTAAKIGSYKIGTSQTQGVGLNTLVVEIQPSGGQSAFQNVIVKVNDSQFGAKQANVVAGANYTFTASVPVAIAANSLVTIDVYADAPQTNAALTSYNPATILIGCSGVGSVDFGSASCSPVNGQSINLSLGTGVLSTNAFPLAISVGSTLASSNLIFGSTGQQIGSYVLTGTSTQAVSINSISIKLQPSGGALAFQNLVVRANGGLFGQPAYVTSSGGTYAFNGSLNIGVGGSANVDVYADVLYGSFPVTVNPATALTACTGYGITNSAPVLCPILSGQSLTLSTTTP